MSFPGGFLRFPTRFTEARWAPSALAKLGKIGPFERSCQIDLIDALERREPICSGVVRDHVHPEPWSAMDKASLPGHCLAEMPKFPGSPPNAVRVIDVLTYPAVQLLDVTGPVQVFGPANDIVVNTGGPPLCIKRQRRDSFRRSGACIRFAHQRR